MPLAPGTRIGVYEVTALLGAGGMGEVYRARDPRLQRDVALKILPDAFAGDPERLARFQREAQVLASLTHPNIGHIYGLEETDSVRALVLELIEGPTLAEHLARRAGPSGPAGIPLAEALAIARQIADALDAAHEHGVIHRDLKPANIKVQVDGTVKVLDFGLAKLTGPAEAGHYVPPGDRGVRLQPDLTGSPTMSAAFTGAGVILGTAAYMAPEQARGRAVDKRADIWAFGCVLFEMLTGKRAFDGTDATEMIAAVVRGEPDWAALPADTPPRLRALLRRCLEKEPKQRVRDIGDVRFELDAATAPPPVDAVAPRGRASRQARLLAAVALVALVALAFAAGYSVRTDSTPAAPVQFSFSFPPGHALISGPVISRDGRRIAYVTSDGNRQQLYVRELGEPEGREIPGTEGATGPFFSPDGRWVAFYARGRLFKVDLEGGAPVALADAPSPNGGTWGENDTIVFTPVWNGGLYRMSANGGQPEPLIRPDPKLAEYAYVWPYFLPEGRELLFTTWGTPFSISRLTLPDLERTVIAPDFYTSAAHAPSGHVLAGNPAGQLQAVPYREGAAIGRSSPVTVVDKVHWSGVPANSEFAFSVSLTGTLAYAPGDITQRSLVIMDQAGRATPVGSEHHAYSWISLAPDGRRAAVVYDGGIWIHDLERGASTPLAPEYRSGARSYPVWTGDSSRVIFASNHEGNWEIYSKPASAAGSAEIVLKKESDQFPSSMAPDGTLVFLETSPKSGMDLWMLPPRGEPRPWLTTVAEEQQGRISPDLRFVAYSSNESGRSEVYVQPLQGSPERVQVSTDGGTEPAWSPKGNRLFYRRGNAMMAVDIAPGERLTAGTPKQLFDAGWELGSSRDPIAKASYAVMPDERFLMIRYEPAAIPTRINVVLNWFDELRRRVPVP